MGDTAPEHGDGRIQERTGVLAALGTQEPRFLPWVTIRVRMGEKDAVRHGGGGRGRSRQRCPCQYHPARSPICPGPGPRGSRGCTRKGRRERAASSRAVQRRGEPGGWGWGPVVLESSGSPGKHQRRTQDFQAPVRKRQGRRPARGPSAPPRALRQSPRPETGESAPGSQASGGARRARSGRGGGSGATYGSGGEGGSGGPSAGPGRRGRTAEAPRLRRAGLRWAPSWSAPRARPAPPEPLHN